MQRRYVPFLSVVFVSALVARPAEALVSACAEMCPSSGASCSVSGDVWPTPGAAIDCTGKSIQVLGRLMVNGGKFTLIANSLNVAGTGAIISVPSPTVETGFAIDVAQNVSISGSLWAVNGGPGSSIKISAGGNIDLGSLVDPVVRAEGEGLDCDGGDLSLTAGGYIHVARGIRITGRLGGTERNTNVGGNLSLSAGGDIVLTSPASVYASGRYYGGGAVYLQAGTDISVYSRIEFDGQTSTGSGGALELIAADEIVIAGQLYGPGGSNQGGGNADGGEVRARSGCGGLTVSGTIDVTAGGDGGGQVVLYSSGDVVVSGTIDASSRKNGGGGGDVAIEAGKLATLTSTALVKANGHASFSSGDRYGGNVAIVGCQSAVLDVASTGGAVEATGRPGGLIALEGRLGSLIPADPSAYSVRVGNLARVTAAGMNGTANGFIQTSVKTTRVGWCQQLTSRACTLSTDCLVNGVSKGPCVAANPDTEGVLTQFTPSPTKLTVPSLSSCSTTCP